MSIRPTYAILMYDEQGRLLSWQLFYSDSKAWREYGRARKRNELWSEDRDSMLGTSNAQFRMINLNSVETQRDWRRQSLLNLHPEEIAELSSRFDIPEELVQAISNMERECAEGMRYLNYRYTAPTDAWMRRYLPVFLIKLLRKL